MNYEVRGREWTLPISRCVLSQLLPRETEQNYHKSQDNQSSSQGILQRERNIAFQCSMIIMNSGFCRMYNERIVAYLGDSYGIRVQKNAKPCDKTVCDMWGTRQEFHHFANSVSYLGLLSKPKSALAVVPSLHVVHEMNTYTAVSVYQSVHIFQLGNRWTDF